MPDGRDSMYRAMIVDDDKWAIEDIRKSFRFHDWGFEVVGEYNNAEDALAMILRAPPDLVISDIRMSKNSGLDMARICREQGVRTLFVIVSGYDSFSYVQDAFRYGVFFYLLKPIEDGQVCELMQRIRAQLDAREQPEEKVYTNDSFGKALIYIDGNFTAPITLESVANALYINKNYLSQLFSKRLGITFTHYRNSLRVHYAKQLIREGEHNMTLLAEKVGFESLSQFSKVFKQIEGSSPQQYRHGLAPRP